MEQGFRLTYLPAQLALHRCWSRHHKHVQQAAVCELQLPLPTDVGLAGLALPAEPGVSPPCNGEQKYMPASQLNNSDAIYLGMSEHSTASMTLLPLLQPPEDAWRR